ncbi:OprD family porin [Salinicola halophyticus]|uniref:OprD family porin n=1 Tax=Salinicola halophyticus TaxID=1808881 RepID=UPI003F477E8D
MTTPCHRTTIRRSRLARALPALSTTTLPSIATPLAGTCALALTLALAAPAQADFLADSTASLEFKNYFITRDYLEGDRDDNKREEWAQGFLLRADSGFTEGPVGFGVDTISMLGVKLDSSPSRSGTGLLEIDDDGRAEDNYTKFGATAKIRAGESVLRYGYLEPRLPSLRPNASRLFTQSFRGTQITSTELDGLELTAGQLNRTRQRDKTDYEPMALNRKSGAYGKATSTRFQFVGGEYHLGKRARLGYHYAQLEDIYRQHYLGVSDGINLGSGRLGADLRYFDASEQGAAEAGEVDNRAVSTRLRYRLGGHSWSGGYQSQFGATPFTYLSGTNVYLFSQYQISNFTETDERVWHVRYDYEFSRFGLPGLTFMMRYVMGDQASVNGFEGEAREWERDVDIEYIVQGGMLEGLSLRWRNAARRANFTRDVNENRVLLGYTLKL